MQRLRLLQELTGFTAGLSTGLVGTGGALVMNSLQVMQGVPARVAGASALAAILPVCVVITLIYGFGGAQPHVDAGAAALVAIGTTVGGLLGARLAHRIRESRLQFGLVVVLVGLGLKELLGPNLQANPGRTGSAALIVLCLLGGSAAGMVTTTFGISGGILLVPFLALVLGMDRLLAQGTSLAAILISNAIGAAGRLDQIDRRAALHMAVGGLVGGLLGALGSMVVSHSLLAQCFGVLALLTAWKLAHGSRLTRRAGAALAPRRGSRCPSAVHR